MQFSSNQCPQLVDSYQEPSHNKPLPLLCHFYVPKQNNFVPYSMFSYDRAEMFLFPEITLLNTKVGIIMEDSPLARLSPTSSMINGY